MQQPHRTETVNMAATLMRCARGVVVSGAKTWRCRQQLSSLVAARQTHRCFSATAPSYAGRLLSEDHEWVVMDGKVGTVGISDHAQDQLGDIVYVECPEVDRDIERGEAVATVESVKAVTEVFTPVSGKVVEINESLASEPGKINKSCYDEGKLYVAAQGLEAQYHQKSQDGYQLKVCSHSLRNQRHHSCTLIAEGVGHMTFSEGVVRGENEAMEEDASRFMFICYHDAPMQCSAGWLYKIELSDMSELESLLSQEEYDKFLENME